MKMAKPLFVMADTDRDYMLPLEIKLVETYTDRIVLEIIDDAQYLSHLLSETPKIDVLIISDKLYDASTISSDIGVVFKLTEDKTSIMAEGTTVKSLYKYSNIQKLFGEIEYAARQFIKTDGGHAEKTKTVLVYSALGGIGKTTMALGLCANLVNNHKKVLYVDAENLQDFAFFLSNAECLPARASAVMSAEQDLYNGLRPYIRSDGFDYLPPLRMSASAMDISLDVFRKFIIECKKHVAYDYIMIDTDSVFNAEKDELLQMVDRVVLLVGEGDYSRYKTELLVNNFASIDTKKYLVVCNKASPNCSERMEAYKGKTIDALVQEIQGNASLEVLKENREIEQISYLL
jgi:cellulose biosynthesis protein BcsQ